MVETAEQNPEVETKTCSMCQKPIELAKYRLHEVACSRQNYKCAKCGEVVPKADREQHELDEHTEKPKPDLKSEQQKPAAMAEQPQPVQQAANGQELQKCPYCPMEFTDEQIQNHISYCGSKTKECPECFSTVQAWMMQAHKETGECANIVLDRQEADDQTQLKRIMEQSAREQQQNAAANGVEQSAFAVNNDNGSINGVGRPENNQVVQPLGGVMSQNASAAVPDDGMDENEREIARIMQEEANGFEDARGVAAAQSMGAAGVNPYGQQQQHNQPMDDGGVRAPDQSRMQVLAGPDPYYGDHADIDYDLQYAREQQRQQQLRINQGIVGGLASGFNSVASGFASLIGLGNSAVPNDQNQRQPQPAGDNMGGVMSEEERQMQLAMAASMGVDAGNNAENPNPAGAVQMSAANNNNPVQSAEDEAIQKAIQESMMMNNAQSSSLEQIQRQNDLYQQQLAANGGVEDEDAMLARVLAESQNQQ